MKAALRKLRQAIGALGERATITVAAGPITVSVGPRPAGEGPAAPPQPPSPVVPARTTIGGDAPSVRPGRPASR